MRLSEEDEDGNRLDHSVNENLGPGPILEDSQFWRRFRGTKSSIAPAHRLIEVCFEGPAGPNTRVNIRDSVLVCAKSRGYVEEERMKRVRGPVVHKGLVADPFTAPSTLRRPWLPLGELQTPPGFYKNWMNGSTTWGWVWLRAKSWLPIETKKWLVCTWVIWTVDRDSGLPCANFISFAILPCWASINWAHLETTEFEDHNDLDSLSPDANQLVAAVRTRVMQSR